MRWYVQIFANLIISWFKLIIHFNSCLPQIYHIFYSRLILSWLIHVRNNISIWLNIYFECLRTWQFCTVQNCWTSDEEVSKLFWKLFSWYFRGFSDVTMHICSLYFFIECQFLIHGLKCINIFTGNQSY